MLKFGDTYLKFNDDYIHHWTYEKPVDRNWKELYHIEPSSFRTDYHKDAAMIAPHIMSGNLSYITNNNGWTPSSTYSGYVSQSPEGKYYSDTTSFRDRIIYSETIDWGDHDYYLIHCQIAPHIILGNIIFGFSQYLGNYFTAYFNGKTYVCPSSNTGANTDALYSAISTTYLSEFVKQAKYQIGISVDNIDFVYSADPQTYKEIVNVADPYPYRRYFANQVYVDAKINSTRIDNENHFYQWDIEPYYEIIGNEDASGRATSSFIMPQTFNILVKNSDNHEYSAYFNSVNRTLTPTYVMSGIAGGAANTGKTSTVSFYTLSADQDLFNEWFSANSASLPAMNYRDMWGNTGTITQDELIWIDPVYNYKGFEIPSFGVSACYIEDPEDNNMLNDLMSRSYVSGQV